MSQTVHVVSIELVTIMEGSVSFQSNEVKGAQKSRLFYYVPKSREKKREWSILRIDIV